MEFGTFWEVLARTFSPNPTFCKKSIWWLIRPNCKAKHLRMWTSSYEVVTRTFNVQCFLQSKLNCLMKTNLSVLSHIEIVLKANYDLLGEIRTTLHSGKNPRESSSRYRAKLNSWSLPGQQVAVNQSYLAPV